MKITMTVKNVKSEEREFVTKAGSRRKAQIKHVLGLMKSGDGENFVHIRAFDAQWDLPKIGSVWTTPTDVRKFESVDGMVYEGII